MVNDTRVLLHIILSSGRCPDTERFQDRLRRNTRRPRQVEPESSTLPPFHQIPAYESAIRRCHRTLCGGFPDNHKNTIQLEEPGLQKPAGPRETTILASLPTARSPNDLLKAPCRQPSISVERPEIGICPRRIICSSQGRCVQSHRRWRNWGSGLGTLAQFSSLDVRTAIEIEPSSRAR